MSKKEKVENVEEVVEENTEETTIEEVKEEETKKELKKPKKVEKPKETPKIKTPKKIGNKEIVEESKEGDFYILKDIEGTTYKLPESEYNAL